MDEDKFYSVIIGMMIKVEWRYRSLLIGRSRKLEAQVLGADVEVT